jgi:hypothetical protein
MRFRRNTAQPTARQKLRTDDLAPAPAAFSYRAKRSETVRSVGRQLAPGVAPARHSFARFWLQRFGLIILLVAVLVSLINILSLSNSAQILPLNSSGSVLLRPTTVYQQAATRELSSSLWNGNKITIDTNKISRQLLQQFPELASVSVTIPLLAHRPLVYLAPAQPVLILTATNGSFVIDNGGKALLRLATPGALDQGKLPVLDDQNNLSVRLNQQTLSSDNVSFVQTVVGQLAAKGFTVSSLAVPADTSELDVHLASQPYFVKFNLESTNPRGETGTFLATISQLRRQNVTPSQYVDVRVDGRAYYK